MLTARAGRLLACSGVDLDASIDSPQTDTLRLGGTPGVDACLLLHGFTGSPWDLHPLAESLAARGYQVLVPRLPGHGTSPRAMSTVTHLDWERVAEESLLSLAHARRLFVAGFSMGALLSLLLAAKYPQRIAALGLLAPAIRLSGLRMALLRRLRRYPILETVRPYLSKDGVDLADPAMRAAAPRLTGFPSARLKDLWTLQDRAWQVVPEVKTPTLVVLAQEDHVVAMKGGIELLRRLPRSCSVRSVVVKRGYHNLVRDHAGPLVSEELGNFFDRSRER